MCGFKFNKSLIIALVSLFSVQAFSQQISYRDSMPVDNSQKVILKPRLQYSLGSSFIFVPHVGSVTGFTVTPFISMPLSQNLSVDGGIIAGRYYSYLSSNPEGVKNGGFNAMSLFGSASYRINSKLTLYGAGIRQIEGSTPFNLLPKSSYIIGSSYNFGNFSIGLSVHMSKWNSDLSHLQFNDNHGFYSPYEQRTAPSIPFGW